MNRMVMREFETATIFKPRYGNFIGGRWVDPVAGRYFDVITPITGAKLTEVARSQAEDVELALDAAHAAREAWRGAPGLRQKVRSPRRTG